MEPHNGSDTVATEADASPRSSVSQEDLGSGLWTEDWDSTEEDRREDPPLTPDLEDAWPDVPLPDWLTEEPPRSIGAETAGGFDGEAEVFRCRPQACADTTWPAEGAGERGSAPGTPEREASSTVTGVLLAREDQASPLDGRELPTQPLDRGLDVERGDEVSVEGKEGTDAHREALSPEWARKAGESHSTNREEAVPTGPSESSPVTGEGKGGDEKHRINSKPLDLSAAREERLGPDRTSSKPPRSSFSQSSSGGKVTDPSLTTISQPSQDQEDSLQPGVITHDGQQGELLPHHLRPSQQEQEAQQVFAGSPPLATVALEPANRGPGCHGCGSVVVRECTAGRREGEGEEQGAGGDKGAEAQPSIAELHTAEGETEDRRETGSESARRADTQAQGRRDGQSSPAGHPRDGRMESANGEDSQSDSGVSVDLSPRGTAEPSPPPPNETPIEREIRNAVERERSLRRSRGLSGTQEFVEIPLRRPILSQALPSKSGKGEGTDRQFAGKKMQREISVEAQREEVLVQMGTVPGVYDKGTVRQLRERKQLFEAFQERRETPAVPASPSKRASASAPEDPDPIGQNQNPVLVGSKEAGFSDASDVLRGPTLSEGTGRRIIIFERDPVNRPPVLNPNGPVRPIHRAGSVPEGHKGVAVEAEGRAREEEEEEEEGAAVVKENPFFRLRSSMSLRPEVEQDIREARQRERELRRQRSSLYGPTGAGGGRTPSQETPSSTPPQNGLPSPEPPTHTASPTLTVRQSLGKLDLTWPPARTSVELAGQTEVPRSRRKIPLLHRWESGMVNGLQEDED